MIEFPFRSQRDWLKFLEEKGQLVKVKEEVDFRGEIAAIARRVRLENGPALLFENIKGFPGWRLACNAFGTLERTAWACGMEKENFLKNAAPKLNVQVPPMEVRSGPCKELKFFGDEVDLTRMPTPFLSDVEGTPQLTAGVENIVDPDTGWQNLAIRRFDVKGKRRMGEYISPIGHFGMIFTKYRLRKKNMPIAIIIGTDPTVTTAVLMKPPAGVCELDLWGAFTGMPLEVVRCETSNLVVPATAEIVIEGEVSYTEREMAGPYSEYTGYNVPMQMVARIDVKCVTMRKDPINQFMYIGRTPCEGTDIGGVMADVTLYRVLTTQFPGVLDVASINFCTYIIVQVDKRVAKAFPDLAKRLGAAIKFTAAAFCKGVIVVDNDAGDIRSPDALWQALMSKFQASKDLTVIPRTQGVYLEPSEPWAGKWGWTDFMILDCTEPPPPYDEGYMRGQSLPGKEWMKLVDEKWPLYGFQ